MSDHSAEELARTAQQATRKPDQAAEQIKLQANRVTASTLAGAGGEEAVKQSGLIYGGLIAIAVVMVQGFLEAPSSDTSARIAIIAFSVAIPLLAALVLVNRQETFRHRHTPSVIVTGAQALAQGAAFVGLVATFWHIYWIAGVVFLAAGFVGLFVHSAGWWRLEQDQPSSRDGAA